MLERYGGRGWSAGPWHDRKASPHVILGVEASASPKAIRQAYLKAIQSWHPDRFSDDPVMRREAEFITKRINEAYDALCRPKRVRDSRFRWVNRGSAYGAPTGRQPHDAYVSPSWDQNHSTWRTVIVACVATLYLLACSSVVYALVMWD